MVQEKPIPKEKFQQEIEVVTNLIPYKEIAKKKISTDSKVDYGASSFDLNFAEMTGYGNGKVGSISMGLRYENDQKSVTHSRERCNVSEGILII
jgi:hypothetical protein